MFHKRRLACSECGWEAKSWNILMTIYLTGKHKQTVHPDKELNVKRESKGLDIPTIFLESNSENYEYIVDRHENGE